MSSDSGGAVAVDDERLQQQQQQQHQRQQQQDARSSSRSSSSSSCSIAERGDSKSKRHLAVVGPSCSGSGRVAVRTAFQVQDDALVMDDTQLPLSEGSENKDDAVAAKLRASSASTGHGTTTAETKSNRRFSADEVGAVHIDEQAPDINRRFYLGLNRPSVRIRQKQARAGRRGNRSRAEGANATAGDSCEEDPREPRQKSLAAIEEGGGEEGGRAAQRPLYGEDSAPPPNRSNCDAGVEGEGAAGSKRAGPKFISYLSSMLLQATLVESGHDGEVVMAEPVGFFERNWKPIARAMGVALALLAAALSLTLPGAIEALGAEASATPPPSSSPTFDPRPTLELAQERGRIRCGLRNSTIDSRQGFHYELCRSVASVVIGNPESFEGIPVTVANRWQHLVDRAIDVLIRGDTHTIEREVKESTTGSGFAFSSPIFYDGMIYVGHDTFVRCAEDQKRFAECSSLSICVVSGSTHAAFLETSFPSHYIHAGSSTEQIMNMLLADECNVLASENFLIESASATLRNADFQNRNFTRGTKRMTKEPHGMVTNNHDQEFSDVVNWVVQALLSGEEEGLTRDFSLCQNFTDSISYRVSNLHFRNAVFCVGNYGDILGEGHLNNRGMNRVNNGTGMLYAVPFGNLDRDAFVGPTDSSMLAKIRNETSLRCGVVVPRAFGGNVTDSDELVGMGVDYCRTLAAGIFIGDPDAVHFLTFLDTDNSSIIALVNGTIDVLVGERVQQKYDFETSPSLGGLHFSTPYYYGDTSIIGDEDSVYSVATHEGDVMFASFVNSIVLATIYAQENNIRKEDSAKMPFVPVFGNELSWALKDAIAYSGSYDKICQRNFGNRASEACRNRNALSNGGPLMHSLPMNHELSDNGGTGHLSPYNGTG